MLISPAYAQGIGGAGGADMLTSFLPLILIFVVFYFLLIRPQQKKQKEHKSLKASKLKSHVAWFRRFCRKPSLQKVTTKTKKKKKKKQKSPKKTDLFDDLQGGAKCSAFLFPAGGLRGLMPDVPWNQT